MKIRVMLELDTTTNFVAIQGENLPDGQAALFQVMRMLTAGMGVVSDQLEDKRLVVFSSFKPGALSRG